MTTASASTLWRRFVLTLEMIKFEHSVFALPFALTGALLAWRDLAYSTDGLALRLLLIVIAMVSARSAAMTFNRLVDSDIDSRNPRTKMRQLPAGTLSKGFAWVFLFGSCLFFVAAAAALGPLCLKLSPAVLGVLLFYSWTKRFTSLSHVVLGFSLGIAPSAAWIAIRGSLDWRIAWLTAAVTLWTAGFDIIYACQDYDFDQREGLFSLPARLGIPLALWVARLFHIAMIGSLIMLAASLGLGLAAWLGIAVVTALIVWEHRLVNPGDLSRIDAAFFTMNGNISVLFFLFWATDILLHWRGL
jgi:4-hydroxybenzoate polyprenyltransferase